MPFEVILPITPAANVPMNVDAAIACTAENTIAPSAASPPIARPNFAPTNPRPVATANTTTAATTAAFICLAIYAPHLDCFFIRQHRITVICNTHDIHAITYSYVYI